jgi:hypothetical protein
MSTARTEHTATLLAGGQVLIAGGSPTFITAELYEPEQRAFKPVADMRYGRQAHTATLLPSRSVLIAGGKDQSGIDLSAAELFTPALANFTPIHPMTTARSYHTATLLNTGQVLIAGGDSTGTAELFDPTTRTFTRTGPMSRPRGGHVAVLLTNGRVLIIGGDLTNTVPGTAELFDPDTGRFSPAGTMHASRTNFTATLIGGGNVLVTGGQWESYPLSSAEIWEAKTGKFLAIQPMTRARAQHTATTLLDGTVLIAGGTRQLAHQSCPPETFLVLNNSVERFNPATGQFTLVTADYLPVPLAGHTGTRLLTGDVLLTGGATLVNELCGMVGLRRIFKDVPTKTATAQLISISAFPATTTSAEGSSSLKVPDTLSFTPAAGLTFRSQLVRTASSAQTATLANSGSSPVVIKSLTASGDFSQRNTCGSSLAAGARCSITVTFTPSHTGPRSGSITVTNATVGSPKPLPLSGIGLTSGPNATLSPTSLHFTTQGAGTASPPQSVTLSNYGTATLTIKSIAATANFTETNTCGALASGESCPIKVTFTPNAFAFGAGGATGRLSVTDNAPGSPQTVSLSGTCVGCIPQGHFCYGPTNRCCPVAFPHHSYCSDPHGPGTCTAS